MPNVVVESLFLLAFFLPPLAVVAGAALLAWPAADRKRAAPVARTPAADHSHASAA